MQLSEYLPVLIFINTIHKKNNYDEIKGFYNHGSNAVSWTCNCTEGYELYY